LLFTPDERRALLALTGLLCMGLLIRVISPGPVPPEGGGDSLLVVLAAEADNKARESPPQGFIEEGRIRINEAQLAALQDLPGIGPAMARRIIEDRQQHGPYRSLRDLERVRGIGPRTALRLAPHLSFGEAPADCTGISQGATIDSSDTTNLSGNPSF
jgi:competence ComEA-like helix-hairpin-helix protein